MSNNFKINAFGSPNAMTPNTIQNSGNNGYLQNFGAETQLQSPTKLIVNGSPNDTPPINTIDFTFIVPMKGIIKKIIINVEHKTETSTDYIDIQNVPNVIKYCYDLAIGVNFFNVHLPIEVGDEISVYSSYHSGKTFVTLYIE
jgi:hypothetical protein